MFVAHHSSGPATLNPSFRDRSGAFVGEDWTHKQWRSRHGKRSEMGTRLFVGNLSFNTTEADLRGAFTDSGLEVQEVKIVLERETGRPRGFAFVELSSAAAVQQAMDQLDGRELGGRQINVKEANERMGGRSGR
jgi:RNA recognition motif-containing protein